MGRPLLSEKVKQIKIVCVTGTRADYGIYRPLLFELDKDKKFDLQLLVTGMHVLAEYGNTIDEIKKDRFSVCATPSILFQGDSTLAMVQSIGMALIYFGDILEQYQPDFVLLLGDRGEMLAAAIAAHYQNVGIIHLHGGEQSGSADDSVRHTISKLAHLHFVSSYKSKEVLEDLGEESWRIFPVGSLRKTEISKISHLKEEKRRERVQKYGIDTNKNNILLLMHPDSKDTLPYIKQISTVISGVCNIKNAHFIVVGPNSDAGGKIFTKLLQEFCRDYPYSLYFSSIPSDEYLWLLSMVDVLIGNSSSGIIESPFFTLPTVNIGSRQRNREQGDNVVNTGYDSEEIENAVCLLINSEPKPDYNNPYDVVASPETEIIRHIKKFCDHPKLTLKSVGL